MTDYVETQTKDGATIRIEVSSDARGSTGFGRQGDGDGPHAGGEAAYEQTLNTIRACANGVIDTLQGLEAQPNAASVDFAIKIDAKAGAMVAKSMSEGQFKISLSWKQIESESDDED